MHKQIFPNPSDLIDHLIESNNGHSPLLNNDIKSKNDRILSTYFNDEFTHSSINSASLLSIMGNPIFESLYSIRGQKYAGMSFDTRFELFKKICRFRVGVNFFNRLHDWLLNGQEDAITFNSSTDISERLRTVVIYADFDENQKCNCYVKLRSSPKGRYLSSRIKQKFGIDTTVNVEFSFPRMGIHSQLFFFEHENDDNFQKATDWEVLHQEEMNKYYQFVNSNEDTNPNNSFFNHKRRIQRELISFEEIKKYLEKDISICGCKFSMLCQNMSGMHSYRYTYFSTDLSVIKDITIESVKNWAVPYIHNRDLYVAEKKNKLLLRLSLFNTPTIRTLNVFGSEFIVIEDIGGSTDGCGFISPDYAQRITQIIREYCMVRKSHTNETNQYNKNGFDLEFDSELIGSLPVDYVPSAFQIRFIGGKGMLSVKEDLFQTHGYHVVLRESMVKIVHQNESQNDNILHSIQVVGFASPSKNARMNIPILHILNGTSDSTGIVQKKIMEQLENMVDSVTRPFLDKSLEEIVRYCVEENDFAALSVIGMEKDIRMAFLAGEFRTKLLPMKIPLPNSRRLYGIADPYGVLAPDEVFVNVSNVGILSGKIIVTKEPCFHRGDLRKVNCASYERLAHLKDVIVFPTSATRPIPNTIAGSDLDGDEYFLCWDEDIVNHVVEFEPGEFDCAEKEYFSNMKSFEPDVFKYWVGIRMSYADYFDKEWTSDKNWNETFKILSDILNSAIDAPKQGGIVEMNRSELIRLIKEYPGHPHYMNKQSGSVTIQSQSLIGKLYNKLLQKTSQILGYQIPDRYETSSKYQKEIVSSMLEYYSRSFVDLDLFDHNVSNLGLGGFIKETVKEIKENKKDILFISEFLNSYWRNLGFGKLENENHRYYCMIKDKLTNLSLFSIRKIIEIIMKENSTLILAFGIHPNTVKTDDAKYYELFEDDTCDFFKFERNYSSSEALLFDASSRIGLASRICTQHAETTDQFKKIEERQLVISSFDTFKEKLKPRFDFLGLCGLGNYREMALKLTMEKYSTVTNEYIEQLDFGKVTHLKIVKSQDSIKKWNEGLNSFLQGEPVNISEISPPEIIEQITHMTLPYFSAFSCKFLGSNNVASILQHLNLEFCNIGNEGVQFLTEGSLSSLLELNLTCNRIGIDGVKYLTQQSNTHFPNLQSLKLDYNAVTNQGLKYLSDGNNLLRLETLSLKNCKIMEVEQGDLSEPVGMFDFFLKPVYTKPKTTNSLEFFCSQPTHIISRLTALDITGNGINIEGARSIGSCPYFTNLKKLSISGKEIGKEGQLLIYSNVYLAPCTIKFDSGEDTQPTSSTEITETPITSSFDSFDFFNDEEEDTSLDEPKLHYGITCDGCEKRDFEGTRWKCMDCTASFDLCQGCFETKTSDHFDDAHWFAQVEPITLTKYNAKRSEYIEFKEKYM